jgi:hypothetical protein
LLAPKLLLLLLLLLLQVYSPDQAVEYFESLITQLLKVARITSVHRCVNYVYSTDITDIPLLLYPSTFY